MTERLDPAEQLLALWRQGQRPDVYQFLSGVGPLGPPELVAVLRIDQQERWQLGEQVPAEGYLDAFPALEDAPEKAVELIYCEFLLREAGGATVALEPFLDRFPAHADRLRQQVELHWALESSSGEGDGTLSGPEAPPGTVTGRTAAGPLGKGEAGGPILPGHEILRELGRGGMGVVYLARDRKRDRAVALKIMQGVGPAELYRFKNEFRSLAGLNHPNLVALYELVAEGDQWFFTMEVVEGVHFLDHVRGRRHRGGLRAEHVPRLRAALEQLAEGLVALHAAGKLHRDVKPGNVLVAPDGRVVLLDFGLAAELDRGGKYLSMHPRLLGTILYMAPEQAACKPVSPAADWYAVGVMLYEALTGRPPFDGMPLAILLDKQQHDPPAPATLAPDAPADLAELCMELLRRDPAARPCGEEVLRRLRASPQPQPGPAPSAPEAHLVGRDRHLIALREALGSMRQGRAVVLAVHGRSGAGKSALLRRFLDELAERDEAVVLEGRCYEQESVPYKALDSLIDALTRHLDGLPSSEAEALLPRDVLTLARVFPVLRRVEAVLSAPRRPGDVSDPQELRRRAVAALRELLGRLSDRRPLVLVIDDLQWGDRDSAAILAELLAPPDPPALLLIGAYRSEDASSSPCLVAFARLAALVEGRELPVEPLTPDERRELVLALLGPGAEAAAEAIARQSGGYPFFVHELVRYLESGSSLAHRTAGDFTLTEVLWGRVQRLPEEARVLLEVVAVAGQPVSLEVACAAAEVTEERPALALLRSGRLLRAAASAERNEVETYHDRVRETVVAHLTPAARRHYHRRLAEQFQASPTSDPEVLAAHWQEAGERERAGEHYARAAERAALALAFERATKLYRLALELRPVEGEEQRRLRTSLGDALAGAGRGAEAAREYQAAASLAGQTGAAGVELQRRAALQYLSSGHVDAGLAALRNVLGAVGLNLCATPRAAFWSLVWQRIRLRLRGLGYRQRAASAVPPAELMTLDICLAAASGLSMVDTIQGAYFQSRALLLALRAGEPSRLVTALTMEAAHESIGGSWSRKRTDKLLRAATELAHELNEPYPRALVSLGRGIMAALEGDWPQARVLCDEAEGTFRESCTGVMWDLGTAQRFALWPLMFMGEVAEIRRRLPGLIKEAQERDDLYGETNLCLVVRTFARLATDEPHLAREELREVMGRWSQQGFHVQHMNRLYDEARIDLYLRDGASAWRRVSEQWPLVDRSHLLRVQQVRIFLRHLRGCCALAVSEDRLAGAERDARALWREKVPWAQALAQLLHAGVAARRGGRRAAELLRDGAERCDAAAMRLFAAAARRRLGELQGGEEGRALIEKADEWMKGQQVVRPDRMAALLVPGVGAVGQAF